VKKKENLKLLGNYSKHEIPFVESILESHDIPTLRKYPETGGYLDIYMGYNAFGIDVYVPVQKIEEARMILKSGEEKMKMNSRYKQKEDKSESKSIFTYFSFIMKGILIIFIILNIGFLFSSLFKFILKLLKM